MKIARLSIVTENQNSFEKADRLATLISNTLTSEANFKIERYEKFDNSYKIDFIVSFENPSNSIIETIKLTHRICSPWTVRLNESEDEIELTFNKSLDTTYTSNAFNVIIWAHWQVDS
jgi:hypothetical protein